MSTRYERDHHGCGAGRSEALFRSTPQFVTWLRQPRPDSCGPLRRRASLGLDSSARHAGVFGVSRKERGRKEVVIMAIYKIMRIYEVPAETQIEATNRMLEAIVLHTERDYHAIDYVKAPADPDGKGHKVDLKLPTGWLTLLGEQLFGKSKR